MVADAYRSSASAQPIAPNVTEGKVDLLVDRSGGHYPGYRCEHLGDGPGVGDYLICPEGTASCPEFESLRAWLDDVDRARP